MNRSELKSAIDQVWHGNQSAAARDLGIDGRRVRAFLADPAQTSTARPIPPGVAKDVRYHVAAFPDGIDNVDVDTAIRALYERASNQQRSRLVASALLIGAVFKAVDIDSETRQFVLDMLGE